VPGGLGVAAPPTGCNLRQGELEKEKVKGEEEERERRCERRKRLQPPMAVSWIRHWRVL